MQSAKTGKSFREYHKLSQTYFQGHTATKKTPVYVFLGPLMQVVEISTTMDLIDVRRVFVIHSVFFQVRITVLKKKTHKTKTGPK